MKRYKLLFLLRGKFVTRIIITEGLKSARYEGNVIATKQDGLKFIKANKN